MRKGNSVFYIAAASVILVNLIALLILWPKWPSLDLQTRTLCVILSFAFNFAWMIPNALIARRRRREMKTLIARPPGGGPPGSAPS